MSELTAMKIPAAEIKLIVFDLDGTLIDSRRDLCNSVNATLRFLGRKELPEAVIAGYIGNGASMLVRRAIGDPEGDVHDQEYVDRALGFFLDYYREHKLDYTYVYDGVFDSLKAIQSAHPAMKMAVLTNKPVGPSRAICEALGLAPYFFQNYGGDSFHTKKPDPTGLTTLMAESEVQPNEVVMIGDSDVDILTARNAGTWSVGCLFGLAPHTLEAASPDVTVDSAFQWAGIFGITI